MADKSNNEVWINFTAADLPPDVRALFDAMLAAKAAFEASFPRRDGYDLRFSYKGADFSRMGMCEIERPKTRDAVKQSLADWIAAQRNANRKH